MRLRKIHIKRERSSGGDLCLGMAVNIVAAVRLVARDTAVTVYNVVVEMAGNIVENVHCKIESVLTRSSATGSSWNNSRVQLLSSLYSKLTDRTLLSPKVWHLLSWSR